MKKTLCEIFLILLLSLFLSLAYNAVSPTPVKFAPVKSGKKAGAAVKGLGHGAGHE